MIQLSRPIRDGKLYKQKKYTLDLNLIHLNLRKLKKYKYFNSDKLSMFTDSVQCIANNILSLSHSHYLLATYCIGLVNYDFR